VGKKKTARGGGKGERTRQRMSEGPTTSHRVPAYKRGRIHKSWREGAAKPAAPSPLPPPPKHTHTLPPSRIQYAQEAGRAQGGQAPKELVATQVKGPAGVSVTVSVKGRG
jgi:hypothetical protein